MDSASYVSASKMTDANHTPRTSLDSAIPSRKPDASEGGAERVSPSLKEDKLPRRAGAFGNGLAFSFGSEEDA
jgi:hypothetical protein